MLESSGDFKAPVSDSETMPPTLHIGIPSINPSIGLSVQLPWNSSSQNVPNGVSINGKDEIRQPHGHMSVFAENFTFRGVESMHRQFMNTGNVVNNGPSILPVPAGYLNGQDSDDSSRRAMQMSLSRPHELHPIVGFGSEEFSAASHSNPHQFGYGGENVFAHAGEAHSGFGEDELSATFAMYRFKVEKCSKQFVHDWKECPYAHEGETARRRHPSTHSAQPCPDFKNSKSCARGNMCPMAHGPWEAGLHPDAYRTNLCAYGHECKRRMCFFAHDNSELRTASSSQQIQQSGVGLGHGQNHVQGGRLHSSTENILRGALPTSHTTADTGGKRVNGVSWASPALASRGGDSQVAYFSAPNRDDFGEISGRFRQMTVDPSPLVTEGGFDSAEIHSQPLVTSQQPVVAEYPQFEVFDRSGSGPTNGAVLQSGIDGDSEESAGPVNLRKRHDGKSRTAYHPSVPPISEDSSSFNTSFGVSHARSGRNVGEIGRPMVEDNAQVLSQSFVLPTESSELDQIFQNPSDSSSNGPSARISGESNNSKPLGMKRNLQVNIPATRLPNPGVSPTEVMLKQDTSWVDKLLESPIEAQHFGARLKFPAP